MSKFNRTTTRPAVHSPIVTSSTPTGRTHEGAPAFVREAKGELFLLAVANLVGENTFYEQASDRDSRFRDLVHQVAVDDAGWMLEFVTWLRAEANMRSAPLVAAAEAVHARLAAAQGTRPSDVVFNDTANRALINAALQRADEPGELLAYWTSRYGRRIPKPVKRGVGDAVRRLYNERNLLKYDTDSKGFRFGDVVDLVHPTPSAPWQADLFRHALDRRHGRGDEVPAGLEMLAANRTLRAAAAVDPSVLLLPGRLAEAGMTWEDALSLAGSRVDKAALWSALIPSMGIMACARNLRNFDEAGVTDAVAAQVIARFADAEQVARSRMFPFRWLAAYRHAPSLRWAYPLEQALNASLANVPALPGRTLVLVDQSPSMFPGFYYSTPTKSDITLADQAKIFGTAIALRAKDATVAQYGNTSELVTIPKGGSVLPLLDRYRMLNGTDTWAAMRQQYNGHDRVIVVTDEQTRPGQDPIPTNVPVYTWNLGGYKHGQAPSGTGQRHTFGGLTDQAFRMISLLEAGRDGSWPWQ